MNGQTERVPIYVLFGRIRDDLRLELNAASTSLKVADFIIADSLVSPILQASVIAVDSAANLTRLSMASVLDVLYQGQDYDIAVSDLCALYDHRYYHQPFTGFQYIHMSVPLTGDGICNQVDVGETVLQMLKSYESETPSQTFKPSYVPSENSIRGVDV